MIVWPSADIHMARSGARKAGRFDTSILAVLVSGRNFNANTLILHAGTTSIMHGVRLGGASFGESINENRG